MLRRYAFLRWPRLSLLAVALPFAWRHRREIRDALSQRRKSRRKRTESEKQRAQSTQRTQSSQRTRRSGRAA